MATSPYSPAAVPLPMQPRSWRERWLNFRNNLIASAAFQRWASGHFLTRGIAHRKARALFDLVAGFVYSQTLFACVRLDLFEILASGPLPLRELANLLTLQEASAATLLRAATALELTEALPDGRYGLGELG